MRVLWYSISGDDARTQAFAYHVCKGPPAQLNLKTYLTLVPCSVYPKKVGAILKELPVPPCYPPFLLPTSLQVYFARVSALNSLGYGARRHADPSGAGATTQGGMQVPYQVIFGAYSSRTSSFCYVRVCFYSRKRCFIALEVPYILCGIVEPGAPD